MKLKFFLISRLILLFLIITLLTIAILIFNTKTITLEKITNVDKETILKYLEMKTENISLTHEGSTMVSAFHILEVTPNKIYIWVLKSEYVKYRNEILYLMGATSLPVVLYIKKINGKLEIINHKFPRDGTYWSRDVNRLFPTTVIKSFNNIDKESLQNMINDRARNLLSNMSQ